MDSKHIECPHDKRRLETLSLLQGSLKENNDLLLEISKVDLELKVIRKFMDDGCEGSWNHLMTAVEVEGKLIDKQSELESMIKEKTSQVMKYTKMYDAEEEKAKKAKCFCCYCAFLLSEKIYL